MSPIEIVQSHYTAISRRDLDGALSPLHPEIEWTLDGPSSIPFAGTFCGVEEVRTFFEVIRSSVTVDEFAVDQMLAQDGHVVVLGHETMTVVATGKSWSSSWAQIHLVVDDRIRRFDELTNTHAIASAFETPTAENTSA